MENKWQREQKGRTWRWRGGCVCELIIVQRDRLKDGKYLNLTSTKSQLGPQSKRNTDS